MLYLSAAALLTLLLTGASAAPGLKKHAKRDAFTVHQVEAKNAYRLPAPVAQRRDHLKYNAQVPDYIDEAANTAIKAVRSVDVSGGDGGGGETGSTTATSVKGDKLYLAPVIIGGKTLNLEFDTGSSDLWVFSSLQPPEQLTGHSYFDVSSGTVLPGENWTQNYQEGSSASGLVYLANTTIGGVTATRQAIGAATSISGSFPLEAGRDGVFGLGFSSANTFQPTQQATFFDTVKGDLASPLFAARLRHGAPGYYNFGSIDETAYKGDLTYSPVDDSTGWWVTSVTGFAVGTNSEKQLNAPFGAVFDTGSTALSLPTHIVLNYYVTVDGARFNSAAGGYIVPCDASLPSLSLTIGGTAFTVPGSYLMWSPVSAAGFDGMCRTILLDSSSLPMPIIGDAFLKALYVVFDSNGPRLGLAPQADVDVTPSGGQGRSSDLIIEAAKVLDDARNAIGATA